MNRGVLRVNAAGAGFVFVFHGRGCRSHFVVFEVAVNAAIAFVVFAVVIVISATVVVVIAIGCFYSTYLLDVDRCE
jgi:hypothetical protein